MANTLRLSESSAHRVIPEPSRVMAKAQLTSHEKRPYIGAALARAIQVLGYSIKEAAALLDMDAAQLSRWMSGGETIQMQKLWGTPLHGPFAIELAAGASGVVVETAVTIRRTA